MRMTEPRSIVSYQVEQVQNYGSVKVKLAQLLQSRGVTRNRLSTLTGVKYAIIDRYYKAERVEMADLDFLAKVCYVLDCKIEDVLEYDFSENAP